MKVKPIGEYAMSSGIHFEVFHVNMMQQRGKGIGETTETARGEILLTYPLPKLTQKMPKSTSTVSLESTSSMKC